MRNQFRAAQLYCLLAVFFPGWAYAQQPMPRVEGESFAEHKVMLPDDAKGKIAVLVFGFTKASKGPTSAWGEKVFSEFGNQAGFELYQLPVLEDVPHFVRGMVISGMKKGIKENMRDHFVPILQGESELKKLVSYKEPDDAYLVVLDPSGQIARQIHGPFSDATYEQLRKEIQTLMHRWGCAAELQFDDLVVVTAGVDGVVQLMQQILAIPRQEVDAANGSLLQSFVRVEGLTEAFGVAAYQFALQRFGAGGLRVELL